MQYNRHQSANTAKMAWQSKRQCRNGGWRLVRSAIGVGAMSVASQSGGIANQLSKASSSLK
jgi:hypothetical protein